MLDTKAVHTFPPLELLGASSTLCNRSDQVQAEAFIFAFPGVRLSPALPGPGEAISSDAMCESWHTGLNSGKSEVDYL